MNKRIKELWDKAGKTHSGESWEELTAFMNCFAELIVKECLHIVDDEGAGEGGCIRAMIRIQEEFGVE